jgi:hypothetical protein
MRLILRGVMDWNDTYGICKYIPLDLKHTDGVKHHDIYMLTSDYARAVVPPPGAYDGKSLILTKRCNR